MTPQKKKIVIGGLIIAGASIAYLIYRSKQNQKEGDALLAYINKAYSQVDHSAAADQAIKETLNIKIDPNKLKVDNLSGKYSPAIRNAISNVMTNLWAAMKGGGTNVEALMKQLSRIKSKNTLAFVDQMFKAQFGTGIFEWMKDEYALNNTVYGLYSDKTSSVMNLIPFSKAYWHPQISAYLQKLPEY